MARTARKELAEPVKTFADAANAYRRVKHIERRLTSRMEADITRWEKELALVPLEDLRSEQVEDMIVRLFGRLKPNSISRYVGVLISILNESVRRGWLSRVPPIKRPSYFDERDEHLTEEEAEKLIAWAFDNRNASFLEAAALLMLLHTGVRVNELCLMDGHTFMTDGIMVRKRQGKTRDTRFIPYSSRMEALYKSGFHKAGGRLFTNLARNPAAMSDVMANVLRRGLASIGVTRHVRVHDLRHTFAFLCGAKGIDLGDLQLLMGHQNISQTMRYRGFIKSRAVSVLAKL